MVLTSWRHLLYSGQQRMSPVPDWSDRSADISPHADLGRSAVQHDGRIRSKEEPMRWPWSWPWSRRRAAVAAAKREQLVPYVFIGGRQLVVDSPYMLPKDMNESSRLDLQHYMLRY